MTFLGMVLHAQTPASFCSLMSQQPLPSFFPHSPKSLCSFSPQGFTSPAPLPEMPPGPIFADQIATYS